MLKRFGKLTGSSGSLGRVCEAKLVEIFDEYRNAGASRLKKESGKHGVYYRQRRRSGGVGRGTGPYRDNSLASPVRKEKDRRKMKSIRTELSRSIVIDLGLTRRGCGKGQRK